jgi:hypothetical protein
MLRGIESKQKAVERSRRYYLSHKGERKVYARDYARKYQPLHKAEMKLRDRNWKRKNMLHGRRVLKRDYPIDQKCELCYKVTKRMGYHHWDDTKPYLGIWCCTKCHRACDAFERGNLGLVLRAYKKLKGIICSGK